MKVVVTGGAGFIGSHIVDLLIKNNYRVCIIDNLTHGKIENVNEKANFYKCDILSQDIINIFQKEKPNVVIHEAAEISTSKSMIDPIKDGKVNILGTINLLEACRKFNVDKFIYSSSSAVYGEPCYLPIDENHSVNMISNYGVSKYAVEKYLYVYKKLYDINYVILRYSNVYGSRQDSSEDGGAVSIFCNKILRNKRPIIYGDGNQTRDFIYVKDVARANLLSLEKSETDVFNVCSNEKISINELFEIISNIYKSELRPIYNNKRLGDLKHSYMCYKRIYEKIGWEPKYGIIEGIKDTIDFYKNKLNDFN